MTKHNSNAVRTDADPNRKHSDARTSRTIRFSDPEWEQVEEAASQRGDSPAEFVRNAALAKASGGDVTDPGALLCAAMDLIESTYRGVYLLATLKRDEMTANGRRDEIDRVLEDARTSQLELTSRS